jgi:hypothetical protein
MTESQTIVPIEAVERRILLIRGQKVLLDMDLADLYAVETRTLKRAVRRNRSRFPPDFMFELTSEEHRILRCQIGTLRHGEHSKYRPFAFTEQGVAMLSGILASPRAVVVNIAIMRAFVRLREMIASNRELAQRLDELESKLGIHDENFKVVFNAIRQLMQKPKPEPEPPKRKIGFHVSEPMAQYYAGGKRRKR